MIKSIALPEFRENPLAKGPVLQGVNATVQDNEFLVALFNGEPMQSTNIDLLKRPGWLDFELRFADGRRGELVFEKVSPASAPLRRPSRPGGSKPFR